MRSTLRAGSCTPIKRFAPLFAALALLTLLPGLGCVRQDAKAPVAKHGVLDISSWAPARDGPVALNGPWEFYWDCLLTPEDFQPGAASPERSGFLRFPGFWGGYDLHGRVLPREGRATFRLRLLPGPGVRRWEMRLFSIPAAFRLWANGRLIASAGVVGSTVKDEIPARSMTFAQLSSDGRPLDLVLQISNHAFRRGGVHYPILLAESGRLEQMHARVWCWAMLFVGGLLSISIYHLFLYFLRKKDRSTLYISVYCLLLIVMYVTMDASDWLSNFFFPDIDSMSITKIGFVCFPLGNSIMYRLYRSLYGDVFILFLQHLIDIKNILFIFICLFLPMHIFTAAFPLFAILSLLFIGCMLAQLWICLRRGYDSAVIFFCGYAFLAVLALGETRNHLFGANPETLFPIGMSAFILSQAFALAQRFSHTFRTVETVSRTLDASNIALRAEMDERNRLEREIINVSEEERRRISHDLHDGLCQRLGGIRLRCGVLEMSPQDDPAMAAEIAEISSLLEDSVNQAYDLSRGLWPVERVGPGAGPSLEELARRVSESSGVAIDYVEDLACSPCVNEHLVQLYRIAQEAVANAVKHAKPSRVVISLECRADRRLRLVVRDDGAGRAAAPPSGKGGLGLHIMRYRARVIGGELSMTDAEPSGTVVACSLACMKDGEPE
ncbi:MAG: 7TM diverse intracellular signaling domain-containing protein [Desulfovibrionaceae bacterium]